MRDYIDTRDVRMTSADVATVVEALIALRAQLLPHYTGNPAAAQRLTRCDALLDQFSPLLSERCAMDN